MVRLQIATNWMYQFLYVSNGFSFGMVVKYVIFLCTYGQSIFNRMVFLQPFQIIVVALQGLCVRMKCKANGVDDGDPSVQRTEKSTANDCILLSTHNQVYRDQQSSQVLQVGVWLTNHEQNIDIYVNDSLMLCSHISQISCESSTV